MSATPKSRAESTDEVQTDRRRKINSGLDRRLPSPKRLLVARDHSFLVQAGVSTSPATSFHSAGPVSAGLAQAACLTRSFGAGLRRIS
jgi:hypothetical protein